MVQLYVAGQKAGTLEDAARVIPEAAAKNQPVEFREDDGRVMGTFTPADDGPNVPWDPSITWADLERIRASEYVTLDEARKRMGWE
jgi:hypothetical protein